MQIATTLPPSTTIITSQSTTTKPSTTTSTTNIPTVPTPATTVSPTLPTTSTTQSITSSPIETTYRLTTPLAQTVPPKGNGLSGGSIFGILVAVAMVLALIAILALVMLKKRKVIKFKLPVLDSIFFPTSDFSHVSLTYKKHPDDNPETGAINPSYSS